MLAIVLIGILGSAWVTEEIGIHFIFGAFIFGVDHAAEGRGQAQPRGHRPARAGQRAAPAARCSSWSPVSSVDIGAIDLPASGELALILLVAISGKFLGAFAAARAQQVPRRQATALGVLMNTRGLTELVILNLGPGARGPRRHRCSPSW